MVPIQLNKRRRLRWIVGVAIVVALVGLGSYGWRTLAPAGTPTGAPVAAGGTPTATLRPAATAPATVAATAAAAATPEASPTTLVPAQTATLAPTGSSAAPSRPVPKATFTPPTPVADARLQQAAEQLGQQLKQERGMVSSAQDCDQVWQTKENCLVYLATTPLLRPEWQQLFPKADFFLTKNATLIDNPDQWAPLAGSQVIAVQEGQRYTAASFPQLLEANGITITEQNRESIAKAFALMTLAYYLDGDVVFSEAGEVALQGAFSFERFNYRIVAWTKLQGLQLEYLFIFEKGHLLQVAGGVIEPYTGDYTDVPPDLFSYPVPLPLNYNFWGR
jgi:hypothetical protein